MLGGEIKPEFVRPLGGGQFEKMLDKVRGLLSGVITN
jgi:hypothetical protein